jgi:hypothetical protein
MARKPGRRPVGKLKPQFYPERNPIGSQKQLAGCTARDFVEAAYAIKGDEYAKKHQRWEENEKKKHKAKVAAVSLAKMPWDDP